MTHDYLGDKAANYRLMQTIREWWQRRGFVVKVWLERVGDPTNRVPMYVVRTNIVQDCKHAGTRYSVD